MENVEHFDSGIISEAVRYVVKYRLVSIAEKTPVQSCPCNRNGSRLRHGTRTIPAYRSVSLTKRYISGAREPITKIWTRKASTLQESMFQASSGSRPMGSSGQSTALSG